MSLSGYPGERRDWHAFDNAPLGEPDADFYATHCQGCDTPLQSDGACLSCMTPDELAVRAVSIITADKRRHAGEQARRELLRGVR